MRSLENIKAAIAFAAFAVVLVARPCDAMDEPTPSKPAKYLGVAACSTTVCHGSVVSRDNSRVLQNEYRIWAERDRHARAHATLSGERAKRIAANLGLGAASEAGECLACHAIDVAAERRGAKYQLSDGVSCEGCHGAAEHWIDSHEDVGATHEENLRRGMYPTDDPLKRAELCLDCHQGGPGRFVSHRMMAAGHPRLSFELDTFTLLEPAHFQVDADYRQRKQAPDSATVWAVGQVVSVGKYSELLVSQEAARSRTWPEFAMFDCFSCHHDLGSGATGSTRDRRGLPGLPRLGAAGLLQYRALLDVLGPDRSGALDDDVTAIVRAEDPTLKPAAGRLAERAAVDAETIAALSWTTSQLEQALSRLLSESTSAGCRTYSDAEQVTMAVQALVATLVERGELAGARKDRISNGLDALFDATRSESTFRAATFADRLAKLRAAL